jgi:uncharacterized membrane protein YfcA
MDLLAGALVVAAASFLGGVTGFGYSLVATPLLLILGFDLPFVVTANLALACVTRISVAYRFRSDAKPGRAAGLIAGSVPGLWLGAVVLTTVDVSTIKLGAGLVVMVAAVLLWRAVNAPPPRELPGAPVAAGFAGGFLGAATSLNGVAPVLLLARDKAAPRSVLADLALYFVVSNAIGLAFLLVEGGLESDALWPAFVLWLPGSLAGNWVGTAVGPGLPEAAFRRLTLAIVFVAGAVTAVTA